MNGVSGDFKLEDESRGAVNAADVLGEAFEVADEGPLESTLDGVKDTVLDAMFEGELGGVTDGVTVGVIDGVIEITLLDDVEG